MKECCVAYPEMSKMSILTLKTVNSSSLCDALSYSENKYNERVLKD